MALATAIAAPACSFGGEDNELHGVARETRAARTARVTRTLTIDRYEPYKAAGVVDFAAERSRFTTRALGMEELIDGEIFYFRPTRMREWVRGGETGQRWRLYGGDPSSWASALAGAEDVERLGPRHYQGEAGDVDFDLWTDESNRARRIRFRDEADTATVVLEYADYGLPVDIGTPNPRQVISAEEHQERLERETCEANPTACELLDLFSEEAP